MGQIDKKLIYRKRKGFDDIKKYTKTVNPDLPGQKIQKGYFKEAILAWGSEGYSQKDIQAWNVYARSKKVITSGFNRFASHRIIAEKEGLAWTKLTNCSIYDVIGEGFKVDINVSSDQSGILYLGISKYSMLKEFPGTFSIDKYTFNITGLEKRTKYYFYIKNTSTGKSGRTGIYCQKTTEKIPVLIDIGSPAIVRGNYTAVGPYTHVDRNNPANTSGKITSVEIYAYISMGGVKVATFYVVEGNYLSTRDYEYIGTVDSGAKRTFPVDIDVAEGDYIGLFHSNGRIYMVSTGGGGYWRKNIDAVPCTNLLFSRGVTNILSLYGTGVG